MTKTNYKEELKYLENYNESIENKIKLIENLKKLININFNNFIKINGQTLN